MRFTDVIKDLEMLTGYRIQSIRPGADIIVELVDTADERIVVQNKNGKSISRSFSELKLIWQKLNEKPAIHVDSVLDGSGTSRNQPETLFANLPYVEWLLYDNKKHISYVQKATHTIGTLKQMDEEFAISIRNIMKKGNNLDYTSICITSELASAVRSYERYTGIVAHAINANSYEFNNDNNRVLFINNEGLCSEELQGTYLVVNEPTGFEVGEKVVIYDRKYGIKKINGLDLMVQIR